jgi:hypothetical protein
MQLSRHHQEWHRFLFATAVAIAAVTLQAAPLHAADALYLITIQTDARTDAGTDADVFFTLGSGPVPDDPGGCAAFPEHELDTPRVDDFEAGHTV